MAEEPAHRSGCERVVAAVERTLSEGGADVAIEFVADMGELLDVDHGEPAPPTRLSLRHHGVVGLLAGRASLVAEDDGEEFVYHGPIVYQHKTDGRWVRQSGRPGQLGLNHPCWALQALRQGCRRVESRDGAELAVELAHEPLHRLTFAGLAPVWSVLSATVRLDAAGRVSDVVVRMSTSDSDPVPWMRTRVELGGFRDEPPGIEVPEHSTELLDYLQERG